jgi:hypothetical protein
VVELECRGEPLVRGKRAELGRVAPQRFAYGNLLVAACDDDVVATVWRIA